MNAISAQRESLRYEPLEPVRGSEQPRLFIIDDDRRSLRIFRRILLRADRHCRTFQDAGELIDALHENPGVAVILSDLRMQHIDGIELITRIRSQFRDRPWLQFILVTGQATMDTAVSALRLEAVDYLLKPVLPKELLAAVDRALQQTRQHRFRRVQHDEALHTKRLNDLACAASMLAAELSRFSQSSAGAADEQDDAGPHSESGDSSSATSPPQSYAALGLLRSLSEQKSQIFGDALAPDAAWEMLIELMLSRFSGRRTCVTSLCLASKTPLTTALRRIDALIDAGLVVRSKDLTDGRRSYVELSDLGVRKMQQYLTIALGRLTAGQQPASMNVESPSIGRIGQKP